METRRGIKDMLASKRRFVPGDSGLSKVHDLRILSFAAKWFRNDKMNILRLPGRSAFDITGNFVRVLTGPLPSLRVTILMFIFGPSPQFPCKTFISDNRRSLSSCVRSSISYLVTRLDQRSNHFLQTHLRLFRG
jgi:hypothetical protein